MATQNAKITKRSFALFVLFVVIPKIVAVSPRVAWVGAAVPSGAFSVCAVPHDVRVVAWMATTTSELVATTTSAGLLADMMEIFELTRRSHCVGSRAFSRGHGSDERPHEIHVVTAPSRVALRALR